MRQQGLKMAIAQKGQGLERAIRMDNESVLGNHIANGSLVTLIP